jgi:hypothetical protein
LISSGLPYYICGGQQGGAFESVLYCEGFVCSLFFVSVSFGAFSRVQTGGETLDSVGSFLGGLT